MKPRIHAITLAVEDLKKAVEFYRDGFGLPLDAATDVTDHVAFPLDGGLYLVLILRAELETFARPAKQAVAASDSSECVLSYFADSREEVDATLKRVADAGGTVPEPAKQQAWGYAGYFKDPDGHLWEVMWNPKLQGEG